jgi:hypothetical protein
MATIEKRRVIRPSSREEFSSYRVHCDKVGVNDLLKIFITHETDTSIDFVYEIIGRDLSGKKSIHFDAIKNDLTGWEIKWKAEIKPKRIK